MGGLGHHSGHSIAIETTAFFFSLLVPGSVFALLAGAWWENFRRRGAARVGNATQAARALGRFVTSND